MRVIFLYPRQAQPKSSQKTVKSKLTANYYCQSKDTTHFSGTNKDAKHLVARTGQSRLYTAANDVHPTAFSEELSRTTDNPNETVAGDTTTLQVLLTNHESNVQRSVSSASKTQQMLIDFFKHPQVKLLSPDGSLTRLTKRILKLKDPVILDAFTQIPEFDIKKQDHKLQKEIWAVLTREDTQEN